MKSVPLQPLKTVFVHTVVNDLREVVVANEDFLRFAIFIAHSRVTFAPSTSAMRARSTKTFIVSEQLVETTHSVFGLRLSFLTLSAPGHSTPPRDKLKYKVCIA